MSQELVNVTAALVRLNSRILIAQRANIGRFASKWELPGGKIDPGESPQECLRRELKEELGLETRILSMFSDTIYSHDSGQIRQFTFWAELTGSIDDMQLTEHQAIAWVTTEEMSSFEFAGADIAVVKLLTQ